MSFKYAAELALIKGCPPKAAKEGRGIAYRFVFNPLSERSFVPPAMTRRVAHRDHKWECSDWALSMFKDKQSALQRFVDLQRMAPQIRKTIGDHIATVRFENSDGRRTDPDNVGHFDFHEYVDATWDGVTRIGEAL